MVPPPYETHMPERGFSESPIRESAQLLPRPGRQGGKIVWLEQGRAGAGRKGLGGGLRRSEVHTVRACDDRALC